ncbi:hypothetical protein CGRA01v4_04442 [Colletotrichum graminicola]|uniref:Uncharacterized protein n=1 Tax=Colletotrichum graminicola (strain M1.001 / M2 / FGSC 10212) TaxID=645133 RepID=E3Q9I9_COLGM|nr:uncharacterized protein GLRG_01863 [Colletotrichum graminicola M1.001]EFQ27368.1 hypothetical protein GLRG_01863 [Colletotrichum graminicola M1.001]WDK13161.1 hypothetical protein CGRA01v4_04442 [Colletotrichum graminicola]
MHFTTTAGLIFAALTPLSSAATCENFGNRAIPIWQVQASGVDDIPGKCGGLWDNLNGFGGCGKSATYCGGSNGNLVWRFTGSSGCNAGVVEATWYRATKNEFGSISC